MLRGGKDGQGLLNRSCKRLVDNATGGSSAVGDVLSLSSYPPTGELVDLLTPTYLRCMPGIGKKSAQRIATSSNLRLPVAW